MKVLALLLAALVTATISSHHPTTDGGTEPLHTVGAGTAAGASRGQGARRLQTAMLWVLEDCPGPSCMNTGGRGERLMYENGDPILNLPDAQIACEAASDCDAIEWWAGNNMAMRLVTGTWEPATEYTNTEDLGYPANIYSMVLHAPHIVGLLPDGEGVLSNFLTGPDSEGWQSDTDGLYAAADARCAAAFSDSTACTRSEFEGADNFEEHRYTDNVQLREHNGVFDDGSRWLCYPLEDPEFRCSGQTFACCACPCVGFPGCGCAGCRDGTLTEPEGCTPKICTDVETPYAGCTCTDVATPDAGCTPAVCEHPEDGDFLAYADCKHALDNEGSTGDGW